MDDQRTSEGRTPQRLRHAVDDAGQDLERGIERVERRLGFRDRYLRRNRTAHAAWRVVVAVVGAAIIVTGVVLLPLPGPGWLIIFAGLAVLASEFVWAQRLLRFAREQVSAWTRWVSRQPLPVRALIGLACLLLVLALVAAYLAVVGPPSWAPSWVPAFAIGPLAVVDG
jgi:uncharacterized protein (TIGR02611 family)